MGLGLGLIGLAVFNPELVPKVPGRNPSGDRLPDDKAGTELGAGNPGPESPGAGGSPLLAEILGRLVPDAGAGGSVGRPVGLEWPVGLE